MGRGDGEEKRGPGHGRPIDRKPGKHSRAEAEGEQVPEKLPPPPFNLSQQTGSISSVV